MYPSHIISALYFWFHGASTSPFISVLTPSYFRADPPATLRISILPRSCSALPAAPHVSMSVHEENFFSTPTGKFGSRFHLECHPAREECPGIRNSNLSSCRRWEVPGEARVLLNDAANHLWDVTIVEAGRWLRNEPFPNPIVTVFPNFWHKLSVLLDVSHLHDVTDRPAEGSTVETGSRTP
ncbi:hypothetical protein B0H13DRAFT_1904980 [Mycena leptocephala]|nr:hypothetical protein B0H13DRAFT_1904980 [Mycena leptocephala]